MRFTRTAQAPPPDLAAPPMPPMPPPGGMPDLGMPPGLGAPPAVPAAAPGAPSSDREEIGSPLDTLGKILYDVDVTTFVMDHMDKEPAEIALAIWELYGGDKMGGVMKERKGERVEKKDVKPEEEKAEQKRTEKTRWKRLPEGQTIADITSLEEMASILKGLTLNLVGNEKKKGAGGGPGGMPSMAASKMQVRLARLLDAEGSWRAADGLDRALGARAAG